MLATFIVIVLANAKMAFYLRISTAFSKLAKLGVSRFRNNFQFKGKSRSVALGSQRTGPRATGKIFEVEPNTTLNHAERTVI
jgi:hypothetical protein